jgi:hypothetical protein
LAPPPSFSRPPQSESRPQSRPNDFDNLLDLAGPSSASPSDSLSFAPAKPPLVPSLSSSSSALLGQGQLHAPSIPKKPVMEPIRGDYVSPIASLPPPSRPQTPVLMPTRYSPSQTSRKPMAQQLRTASRSSSEVRPGIRFSTAIPNSLFELPTSSQPESSFGVSSRAQSPADKILSQFALPPPSSRPQTPATTFPTPSSSSLLSGAYDVHSIPRLDPPSSVFDDDEFSDFHSPPSQNLHHPADLVSKPSPSSPFSLLDRSHLRNGNSSNPRTPPKTTSFNDFDDFISSPFPSPTPPPPPSKSSPMTQHSIRSTLHRRTGSLADHSTTHRDSHPLPQSLPPPPVTSYGSGQFDLLGDLTPMKDGNTQTGKPRSGFSSPAMPSSDGVSRFTFPPPPRSTFMLPPPASSSGSKPSATPARTLANSPPTVPSTGVAGGTGGLSAQDLLFFEGF